MTKRPTKTKATEPTKSDEVDDDYAQQFAGQGWENSRLSDYGAPWYTDDGKPGWKKGEALRVAAPALLDLLDQIDRTKEPRLLLSLLNLPPVALPHFEDLFERLVFKSRSRRTPSYRLSDAQQKLMWAIWEVRNLHPGVTQAEAITEVAKYWGINCSALEKAVTGHHTSLGRALRKR
jgi:hypothetical protein